MKPLAEMGYEFQAYNDVLKRLKVGKYIFKIKYLIIINNLKLSIQKLSL